MPWVRAERRTMYWREMSYYKYRKQSNQQRLRDELYTETVEWSKDESDDQDEYPTYGKEDE